MDLRRLFGVLRRRWPAMALCVAVGLAIGLALTALVPPVYEAQVALLVRPAQPLSSVDPGVISLTSDQVSRTYAGLMIQRPLLEQVIGEEHLTIKWDQLKRILRITPEPNTTIIDVTVDSTNPATARDVANRLVADFTAQIRALQASESPAAAPHDSLVVAAPALLPDRPISPRLPLDLGLGLAGGLLAGLALTFGLENLDQSITDAEMLQERTGLYAIGQIGYAAPGKEFGELGSLQSQSSAAEAYRALRTNLLFSKLDRDVRTVVVTSGAPYEGKSRTAANLAVVLAEAGHRTLIVDADFRRPSQHRIFRRVRNLGLTNVLLNENSLAEMLTGVENVKNLSVLTSGPKPPNPSEVLGSLRMKTLITELSEQFAFVVIDSPPVHAVTDPTILAAMSDATVLVAESRKTTYGALVRTARAVEQVGGRVIGVVLNKMKSSGAPYSYRYESNDTTTPRLEAAAKPASAL